MKKCPCCGREVSDYADICVNCKTPLASNNYNNYNNDTVNVGLVVLSVLIPLFGIIYWAVKAKERPRCAKTCGIAAIISWAVCFLFYLILLI